MSDAKFIEVVATARVNLIVGRYRAMVSFTVEAGRKRSCLTESILLRDKVITALKAAGIAEADIEEGGGQVRDSGWSGRHVQHHIHVEHEETEVLVKAMAQVEDVFTNIKRPWFSGLKHTFSFGAPEPQFKPDVTTKEEMLRRAMENARKKAEALASGLGLRVGGLAWIIETAPMQREPEVSYVRNEINALTVDYDDSLSIMELTDSPRYTPAAPLKSSGQQVFRVRFDVTAI